MSEDGSPTPFDLTLNATDPDADELTWAISSGASGSQVIIANTGAVSYEARTDFFGTDSFIVSVTDPLGSSDFCEVDVEVSSVNDAPDNVLPPTVSGAGTVGSLLTCSLGSGMMYAMVHLRLQSRQVFNGTVLIIRLVLLPKRSQLPPKKPMFGKLAMALCLSRYRH